MEVKAWIHWLALMTFAFVFCKAGLYKVLKIEEMMEGMKMIGFDEKLSVLIGWVEVLGVAGLLFGIRFPAVKLISILGLWVFAISALAIHISYHHPIAELTDALLVTCLPVLMLATDKEFKIEILHS